MYVPSAFAEADLNKLCEFIEQYSFGTLISQVDGQPFATHLPLLIDAKGARPTLIGHTARANPQCLHSSDQTVLAIFHGPHTYISPAWYESENVVPTWNYVAVHVYGKLQLIDDEQELAELVGRMTDFYERSLPVPWSFDKSTTYAQRMVSQIIGFRMLIEQIEGKWKISQNHPLERQQKVIEALKNRPDDNSQAIGRLMEARTRSSPG